MQMHPAAHQLGPLTVVPDAGAPGDETRMIRAKAKGREGAAPAFLLYERQSDIRDDGRSTEP